mmetsp:Transcript_13778/g.19098  ORF Transcript_13778/g.19098 Transcript_13778/m.19098 type:complete len:181 (+) Transcript_13778:98-640(+)|eukprot:CAMPEP_0185264136 /NCGR_PEP_ID=MMETSP1359-20130426/19813_1 /TAXON_ID=552665 /ORGANISM="Bigelowiella longifila, Strain CCMP242" /LENGTH=180 /DNA_ID=CAMNT_0027852361 /DNA_START=47 /DNA_END=589 /DNA_ORIENTATION=-
MARVKRVTNSWKKGCKTIFKVGGDGTTFYLVSESGVKLMRRAQAAPNQQNQGKKEEKNKRQSRKRCKPELSHEEWIRYARKKKRAMTKIFRKPARKIDEGAASNGPQPEGEYSTEAVLGRRWRGNRWEYRVKWKGYKRQTWEPVENLTSDGVHNKDLLHFLKATGGSLNDVPHGKDVKQK